MRSISAQRVTVYNAGMTREEEKAKRWRVTIRQLLISTAGICVGLSLLQIALRIKDIPLLLVAMAILGGCVGAILGLLFRGTSRGAIIGMVIGGFGLSGVCLLLFLALLQLDSPLLD